MSKKEEENYDLCKRVAACYLKVYNFIFNNQTGTLEVGIAVRMSPCEIHVYICIYYVKF